jgi:hypothetical protein
MSGPWVADKPAGPPNPQPHVIEMAENPGLGGADFAAPTRQKLMSEVDSRQPGGDTVRCVIAIALIAGACAFALFTPPRTYGVPVFHHNITVGVLGSSNGAGVLAWFASPVVTVLFAVALADRDRLFGVRVAAGATALVLQQGTDGKNGTTQVHSPVHDQSNAEVTAASCGGASAGGVHPIAPDLFDSPTARAYLERCRIAADELEQVLRAEQCPVSRTELGDHLAKKYGLRHSPRERHATSAGDGVVAGGDLRAALDARAKVLRSLVMRFPDSPESLAQGDFEWAGGCAPMRSHGEAALDMALLTWTDKTTSAADSALFSKSGVWVSPFTFPLLVLIGAGYGLGTAYMVAAGSGISGGTNSHSPAFLSEFPFQDLYFPAIVITCSTTAAALRKGHRRRAMRCWAVGTALTALCSLLEGVSAGCECWGPYAEQHAATGNAGRDVVRNYPWSYAVNKALTALAFLPLYALTTHPWYSFPLLYVATPALLVMSYIPFLTDFARFNTRIRGGGSASAVILGVGAFLWRRRQRACALAHKMGIADAERYDTLWESKLQEPGFRVQLADLWEAWKVVQESAAADIDRKQLTAPGIGALFREADKLNDVLHIKLHDLCTEHGGTFHRSDVKAEARALQKVFRTYGGEWRRLNDLCRSSLVFTRMTQIAKCLRAIAADDELEVVPSHEDKMRLRESFNAIERSGGYRDVQLTVRLNAATAQARKVDRHLAEVQLHFEPIIALKSNGGHKTYVLRRNLSGQ